MHLSKDNGLKLKITYYQTVGWCLTGLYGRGSCRAEKSRLPKLWETRTFSIFGTQSTQCLTCVGVGMSQISQTNKTAWYLLKLHLLWNGGQYILNKNVNRRTASLIKIINYQTFDHLFLLKHYLFKKHIVLLKYRKCHQARKYPTKQFYISWR